MEEEEGPTDGVLRERDWEKEGKASLNRGHVRRCFLLGC